MAHLFKVLWNLCRGAACDLAVIHGCKHTALEQQPEYTIFGAAVVYFAMPFSVSSKEIAVAINVFAHCILAWADALSSVHRFCPKCGLVRLACCSISSNPSYMVAIRL